MSPAFTAAKPAAGYHREGHQIVLDQGVELPPRCIRCNGNADVTTERKLRWHSPWYFLLLIAGLIPYILIALLVSKRTKTTVSRCAQHHQRRLMMRIANALAIVGGFGLLVAGGDSMAAIGALTLLFGALSAVATSSSDVRATRIDEESVRLKGFGEAFVSSISSQRRSNVNAWESDSNDWSSAGAAAKLQPVAPIPLHSPNEARA